jgi:hypothetical protein
MQQFFQEKSSQELQRRVEYLKTSLTNHQPLTKIGSLVNKEFVLMLIGILVQFSLITFSSMFLHYPLMHFDSQYYTLANLLTIYNN